MSTVGKKPSYLDNLDKLDQYPDKLLNWIESKPPGEDMSDDHWAAYCMEWEKVLGWLNEDINSKRTETGIS